MTLHMNINFTLVDPLANRMQNDMRVAQIGKCLSSLDSNISANMSYILN